MNLKLNNEVTADRLPAQRVGIKARTSTSVKEERQRTGRYIAILVGICLFLLAIYHAWVRRIPIVASLVVPALIMFVYVGWVLFTANRDKHREWDESLTFYSPFNKIRTYKPNIKIGYDIELLDAEAAYEAARQAELDALEAQNNLEASNVSSRENSNLPSPEETNRKWAEISSALLKEVAKDDSRDTYFVKPVILINDKLPKDPDQKWTNLVQIVINNDKLKGLQSKRKFKRKFCRRRHAVYKRSYSIA